MLMHDYVEGLLGPDFYLWGGVSHGRGMPLSDDFNVIALKNTYDSILVCRYKARLD